MDCIDAALLSTIVNVQMHMAETEKRKAQSGAKGKSLLPGLQELPPGSSEE